MQSLTKSHKASQSLTRFLIGILLLLSSYKFVNGQVQYINTSVGSPTASSIGENNSSVGDFSFSGGRNGIAASDFSFVFGDGNASNFPFSTIFGKNNKADGDFVFIFGENNTAIGIGTYSFGELLSISGHNSYAFGSNSSIGGLRSFTFGSSNLLNTDYSFLIGNNLYSNSGGNNVIIMGNGLIGNPLTNSISNSLVISFNSNLPTFFVGPSNGANSTGNIGVSTTTPGSKLQVNGNTALGYSNSTIAPTNGLAVSGDFGLGITNPGSKMQINGNASIGYSTSISSPVNGLLVNGDFGLGTTTPGSKLQINGNAAVGYSLATTAPANGLIVNGNVGIGIPNPYSKLQVNGNAAIGYSTSAIYNIPTNGAIINGSVGIGTDNPFGKTEIVQTGIAPALSLRVDHADDSPIIRFFTNQPTQPAGNHSYFEFATLSTSSNFTSTNILDNKCLSLKLETDYNFSIENGGLFVGYAGNTLSQLKIATNGINVLGAVSIGTEPFPNYKLTVAGSIFSQGFLALGAASTAQYAEFLISKDIGGSSSGIFYKNTVNIPDTEFDFQFDNNSSGSFNFYKTREAFLFTITTEGDVGINQKNPQATLHIQEQSFDIDPTKCKDALRIDGNDGTEFHPHFIVKSNGFVYAREINVLLGNLPSFFPDYVFSPDYNLMTIDSLERYINENQHLPEVPTAEDMSTNGINAGEMNVLLLKKVEELTLHIIELNKRIEKLEAGSVSDF